jgi:hypothetical protein
MLFARQGEQKFELIEQGCPRVYQYEQVSLAFSAKPRPATDRLGSSQGNRKIQERGAF